MSALRSVVGVLVAIALAVLLTGCQILFEPDQPPATWMPLPSVAPTETMPPPTEVPTETPLPTATPLGIASSPTHSTTVIDPAEGAAWGRDQAWAYLLDYRSDPRQPQEPDWEGPAVQGIVGATKYTYSAGEWSATVAVPLVAPDKVVYDVRLTGPDDYVWQAQVYPNGHIVADSPTVDETPTLAPTIAPTDVPPTTAPTPTETAVSVQPTSKPTAKPQPSTEIVEGWVGVVRTLPRGEVYDDFFDGQDPRRQYGIQGAMGPIDEQLANAAASGAPVRIYGVLELGVDDFGGGRIVVSHIE